MLLRVFACKDVLSSSRSLSNFLTNNLFVDKSIIFLSGGTLIKIKWRDCLNETVKRYFQIINTIQRGFKIKDTITASLFSGLLGTLAMESLNIFLWKKGKSEVLFGHIAGSIFVRPFRTNQRKNYWLGKISYLITGSTLAIPLNYIMKKTGKDNSLLKGTVYATIVWEIVYGMGQRLKIFAAKPHLTKTHYAMLINHTIYGLVTTQAMVAFSEPTAFPDIQSKTTTQNTQINKIQPMYPEVNYNVRNSDTYQN